MDDAQIVQLYWDRDEQAIRATADKYGNYCTSIAMNIQAKHSVHIPSKNYKKPVV